jgi:hypothetical protein
MPARKVYKYPVPIEDTFTLTMPLGAQVLCMDMQGSVPHIWALVDPSQGPEVRHFRLAGTGHDIEGAVEYLGSFQMHGGALVFHLFEAEPFGARIMYEG